MKTVAYYISDYGFGHAARSIAVIRELLRQSESLHIIVCHSFAQEFLKQSLPDERVTFRCVKTDVGYYLKENTLEPDKELIDLKVKEQLTNWSFLIHKECLFLRETEVDLVISDISPIGISSAFELGIPTIGISNFTWHTAYQGLIRGESLEFLKRQYDKMSYFFSLAGSQEPKWGTVDNKQFGFYSRELDLLDVQRIKDHLNPTGDKIIVFFGLGMKINDEYFKKLELWNSPNCIFVTSYHSDIDEPNIVKIPKDYLESQNYIAAADMVISKAGWGTISEGVCGQTPLVIVNRKSMQEDKNTIEFLENHHLCELITEEELDQFMINESFIKKVKKQKQELWRSDINRIGSEILAILN